MAEELMQYVCFESKVSVKQEIVDTDSGEILFTLESSVLRLNVKYFSLILVKFIKFLREGRTNIFIRIRSYSVVHGTSELGLGFD